VSIKVITYFYQSPSAQSSARSTLEVITDFHWRSTAPCLADLVPDDLAKILGMLTSTLWTMDPGGHGWRRYLALICEGLTSVKAGPLPPPRKLLNTPRSGDLGPPTTRAALRAIGRAR
jgi:hypothetical protein